MSDRMCAYHEHGDVKCDYVAMSQKLENMKGEYLAGGLEIDQLRLKLRESELQLGEAKKALAQYVNVFLPGSICPANDLFQPGGMFHEPPKPWTQEQKEALAKVADAFTEKRVCDAEKFGESGTCGLPLPCKWHKLKCEGCGEPEHYGGKPGKDCGLPWPG